MKPSEVKKAFTLIAKDSRSIRCLNMGGCGVYAVELGKRLSALGYNDFKLRIYGYTESNNVTVVEKKLKRNSEPLSMHDWNRNGVSFCHVVVQWRGMLIDSSGIKTLKDGKRWNTVYTLQRGNISLDSMKEIASTKRGWNKTFKRTKNVPLLRKIINLHLPKKVAIK